MEKLMKPAEYAQELGISRQAVYAKIKRGILTAKNVDGKLYIVVDNEDAALSSSEKEVPRETKTAVTPKNKYSSAAVNEKEYEALLAAKDETISVLKGTVKDLKKSNKQISRTLRGEIDLLKDAFHEMRSLYVHQLAHKEHAAQETIDVLSDESAAKDASVEPDSAAVVEERWVTVKKFCKKLGVETEKQQIKLLKRLKKAYKSGDEVLKKEAGKLMVNLNNNYKKFLK